jgi:hypothetical protein
MTPQPNQHAKNSTSNSNFKDSNKENQTTPNSFSLRRDGKQLIRSIKKANKQASSQSQSSPISASPPVKPMKQDEFNSTVVVKSEKYSGAKTMMLYRLHHHNVILHLIHKDHNVKPIHRHHEIIVLRTMTLLLYL